MKRIFVLLATALSLVGCSTVSIVRPNGTGITETNILTKSTLATGQARVTAEGGEIKITGLENDPSGSYALILALAKVIAAGAIAAPPATNPNIPVPTPISPASTSATTTTQAVIETTTTVRPK